MMVSLLIKTATGRKCGFVHGNIADFLPQSRHDSIHDRQGVFEEANLIERLFGKHQLHLRPNLPVSAVIRGYHVVI
jgi:hypothetical protein